MKFRLQNLACLSTKIHAPLAENLNGKHWIVSVTGFPRMFVIHCINRYTQHMLKVHTCNAHIDVHICTMNVAWLLSSNNPLWQTGLRIRVGNVAKTRYSSRQETNHSQCGGSWRYAISIFENNLECPKKMSPKPSCFIGSTAVWGKTILSTRCLMAQHGRLALADSKETCTSYQCFNPSM